MSMVVPPVANQSQRERDLEMQQNNEINSRESGDTRTEYQSTVLPASAVDFDPEPHRRLLRQFGNPAPLGLCGFALTTFVLSLINVQARSILTPNIVIGLAFAYGGAAQFMAGMWEFACGNTFGALAFTSYGAFWISFAAIFVPWFNIAAATGYGNDPAQFEAAMGIYLLCWSIFTWFLVIGTLRSSIAFFGLFFTLAIAFLMLSIGWFRGQDTPFIKAGGYFGLFAALFAWYNACAGIWHEGNAFFKLPLGQFPWAEKGRASVGRKPRKAA